jgi:hypothetical protein
MSQSTMIKASEYLAKEGIGDREDTASAALNMLPTQQKDAWECEM